MSSIDDLTQDAPPEQPTREAEFVGPRPSFQLPAFLTANTGEGQISDYLNHPLNFNESLAVAQIIRGATGMLGSLNKAVFDIVFGFMRLNRKPAAPPKPPEDFTI